MLVYTDLIQVVPLRISNMYGAPYTFSGAHYVLWIQTRTGRQIMVPIAVYAGGSQDTSIEELLRTLGYQPPDAI